MNTISKLHARILHVFAHKTCCFNNVFKVLEHLSLEEKVQVIGAISNMMVESFPPTTEEIIEKQKTLPENLQVFFLDAFREYLLTN